MNGFIELKFCYNGEHFTRLINTSHIVFVAPDARGNSDKSYMIFDCNVLDKDYMYCDESYEDVCRKIAESGNQICANLEETYTREQVEDIILKVKHDCMCGTSPDDILVGCYI